MKLTLDTNFNNGLIEQSLKASLGGTTQTIATWAVNVRERHIRDALVAMGWTPPNDDVNDTPDWYMGCRFSWKDDQKSSGETGNEP